MPVSLSERVRTVSQAFYRLYDNPQANIWYYIRDVYDDHIIATDQDQKSFRITYDWNDGEPTYAPAAEWEEVRQEWVPARSLDEDKRRKDELLGVERRASIPAHADGTERSFGLEQRDFRAQVRFTSDENRSTFLITTAALARDGMILEPDGIDTAPYMQNPVVLWNHGRDIARGGLPVGRTVSLERKRSDDPNQNGWLATMEWYTDEFSQNLRGLVRGGFVSMASIKWQPKERTTRQVEGRTVPVDSKSEMLEFSIVDIGADRNALPVARGLDADVRSIIREEITSALQAQRAQPAAAPSESAASIKDAPAAEDVPAPPKKRKVTAEQIAAAVAREVAVQINRTLGRA